MLSIVASNETAGRYYCKAQSIGFTEISAEALVILKGHREYCRQPNNIRSMRKRTKLNASHSQYQRLSMSHGHSTVFWLIWTKMWAIRCAKNTYQRVLNQRCALRKIIRNILERTVALLSTNTDRIRWTLCLSNKVRSLRHILSSFLFFFSLCFYHFLYTSFFAIRVLSYNFSQFKNCSIYSYAICWHTSIFVAAVAVTQSHNVHRYVIHSMLCNTISDSNIQFINLGQIPLVIIASGGSIILLILVTCCLGMCFCRTKERTLPPADIIPKVHKYQITYRLAEIQMATMCLKLHNNLYAAMNI